MTRTSSRRQIPSAEHRTAKFYDHFGLFPNGKRCCLCGQVLRDAADEASVYVRLSCRVLFLHAPCALRLGEKLVREGTEAEEET
ncbi:MAG TPA: hypothetical protein VM450_06055 [Thermomicrobiales bacterium]|nr:hypothetical protein [Thermomicrobiales bacterium]